MLATIYDGSGYPHQIIGNESFYLLVIFTIIFIFGIFYVKNRVYRILLSLSYFVSFVVLLYMIGIGRG